MRSAGGTTGSSWASSARSGRAATSSTSPSSRSSSGSGLHYLLAATGSFLVAVTNNYIWNRLWTFRGQRGHVAYQGLRFLVVPSLALRQPRHPPRARPGDRRREVLSAGHRDRAGHPAELRREQALVVRAALAAFVAGLALAAPAAAATTPSGTLSEPVYDDAGRLIQTPFVPSSAAARLTENQATEIMLRYPKVAAWLDRYPPKPQTDAEYRAATDEWIVKAWSGDAGQIVLGKVDDRHRPCEGGLDRPTGRVDDGARRRRCIRRQDDQRHLAVARVLRALLRRARRPAQASLAAEPRPPRAAVVLDLASALQRGRDLLERAARLSAARLPARPLPLDRAPRPAAARVRAGLAGLAARRRWRSSWAGSGSA